jgi:hypothetical protein
VDPRPAPWPLRLAEGFVYTLGAFVLLGHVLVSFGVL